MSGREPRVSVVIPCYNYGKYLAECVESVLAQTYRDHEILIVDDGSTDATREVAARLIAAHGDRRIQLIAQENSGQPAYPRNAGIARARGEHVLCLDADDRIAPGFLEECVRALDECPEVSIAYPEQQNFGARDDFEHHPDYDFERLTRFNFIPTASLFRKRAWEEVGGYATNVPGYEDWEFWIGCGERGHFGRHVPRAVWFYRVHSSGLYTKAESRDQRLKAQVVLNHPRLYTPTQVRWAEAVLRGDPAATAINPGLGIIPRFADRGTLTPALSQRERGKLPLPLGEGRGEGVPPSPPLHVLFTMYGWAEEGGGTVLPRQVARALARRGHRVTVVYTAAQRKEGCLPYHVEEARDGEVRLFAIYNRPALFYDLENPGREANDPTMRRIVAGILAEVRPDVVHYHSLLNFSMAVAEEVHGAGIPAVYTSHNYWPLCPRMYLLQDDLTPCGGPSLDGSKCGACTGRFDLREGYAQRAERGRHVFGRSIDRHLAVSRRVRHLFTRSGHDATRIHVLHQQSEAVDWIWQRVGRDRQPCRQLSLPLKVGYFGSLLGLKGPHVLARALQAFRQGQVEAHLFGAGPEPYLQLLREIDRKGLLRFHGRRDPRELPQLFGAVDVVAIPSVGEDCAPLVAAEALAARAPVVGSRTGGLPDFVEDGVDGLLFDPRDAAGLAATLYRFLDDPTLLGRLQQNVQPPRGFDAYLDELVGHYQEVIAEQAAAGPMGAPEWERDRRQEPAPTPGAGEAPLAVVWEGSQFVHHSLALVNRELCLQLIEAGQEVSLIPYEPDQFGPGADPRFGRLASRVRAPLSRPPDVHLRHQWPPSFTPPQEGHWVMIQPWEFGSAPRRWVEEMSARVDEIWVPSSFVRECYLRGGVPADRVHVVPNGVDTGLFRPEAPPMALKTRKRFKFLFVGGTIWRKGPDVLLDAYLRAFTAEDDVCLVIKEFGGGSFYRGQTAADRIRQIQATRGAPEILYLAEDVAPGDLPGLYAACDCLVHPYRGEGFGLPIAEAMACGLPVVVTGEGACLDFCDETVAYLIPACRRDLPERRVDRWETVDTPFVYEPDREATAALMRHVFENPVEARAVGARAAERIQKDFTWARAAERAMERMRALRERPVLRLQASSAAAPGSTLTAERAEIAEKSMRTSADSAVPAVGAVPLAGKCGCGTTPPRPLEAVLVGPAGSLAGMGPSLAAGTSRPLSIVALEAPTPSNGKLRPGVPSLPEGWQLEASALPLPGLLNRALQGPGDEPVLLLSPDLVVTPGWLGRLLAALERDPEVVAAGPVSNHAPTPQRVKARYEGTGKELRRFAERRAREHAGGVREAAYLGGFCLAFSRLACRALGPLREDLDPAAALWEYFGRIRESGRKLAVALDAYVHHEKLSPAEGAGFDALASAEEAAGRALAEARAALEGGDLEAAARRFAALADRLPELAAAHAGLGSALMALGRFEEAVPALQRAAGLSPVPAPLHNQLGVALYQAGDPSGAESAFLAARESDRADLQPLLNLIDLYRGQERYPEATAAVKEALSLDPNHAEVLLSFGVLSLDLGDGEGAGMALRRLRRVQPDHPGVEALQEALESSRGHQADPPALFPVREDGAEGVRSEPAPTRSHR